MKLETVKKIVEEVYPKIEKFYGSSKFFPECTPYIEYETSIYGRLSGEEDDGSMGEQCPDAEYCSIENAIFIYYPKLGIAAAMNINCDLAVLMTWYQDLA